MADGIDDDAWVYVLSPDEESNSDDEESLHSCTDAMSYEAVATTSDDGDGDASSQDDGGAGTEGGEARSEPDGGGGFYGSTEVDDFLYLLDQEAAGKGDAPTDGGDAVVVDAGAAAAPVKIDGDSGKAVAAEEHGGDCGGRGTDAEGSGSGDSGKAVAAEEHGGDCGGRSTDAKGSGSRYGCLYCYNDGCSYGTCFCSGSGAGAGSYSYGYGGYSGCGGGDSYCDVHGYGYTYSCGHGCGGCYGYYRNRYDIPSVYRPRRRRRAMYYPAVGSYAAQYGYATTASLYGAVYLLVPLYS